MRRVAIVLFGLAAAALIVVVALVAGSRQSAPPHPIRVLSAATSDGSRLVDVTLAQCPGRVFGTLDEQADSVHLEVTGSAGGVHPCPPVGMPMQLKRPLGDRPLIDASDGKPISVQKVPANQLQGPLTRPERHAIKR